MLSEIMVTFWGWTRTGPCSPGADRNHGDILDAEIPQTWTWKWFWVFVLCCRTYRCCRKCNFKCDSSVQERETLCGSTKLLACLSAIVMPLRTALHKAAEKHTLLQTGSNSPCSGTNATTPELPTSYSMQTSPLLDCNTTISCLPYALNSQGGLRPWFNPTQNSTVTTAIPVSIQHCRPKNVGHRRVYMNWWLLSSAWSLQSYLRFPVHRRGCRKFCKPPPPHTSFQTIWRTWTAVSPVDSFTHTIQRIPNWSSSLQNSQHSAGNFWEDSEKDTVRGNKRIVKISFDKYLKIWLDKIRTTEREAVSRDTKSLFLLSRTNISAPQATGRRNHLNL